MGAPSEKLFDAYDGLSYLGQDRPEFDQIGLSEGICLRSNLSGLFRQDLLDLVGSSPIAIICRAHTDFQGSEALLPG